MILGGFGLEPAPRPFLKWAGGKRQLIATIEESLPRGFGDGGIERYIEPFIGGGALFFHVRQKYDIGEFHISDFNPDLTNCYVAIRDDLAGLLGCLGVLADDYLPLSHEDRGEMFYRVRDEYNESRGCLEPGSQDDGGILRAARTIFLNRTCFNGLFRVNSRGDFNVPHGRYKAPPIRDEENLASVSMALQGVEISCGSYEICEPAVDGRTFVYLDPPYRPLPNTPSFTDYAQKSSFGDGDQRDLAAFYDRLDELGASLMLSNSDPKNTDPEDEFFDDLYSRHNVKRVSARRVINSDGKGRGDVSEILVTNYDC